MPEEDDPTITNEARLLRRIPVQPSFIQWDSNLNRFIISSQAFRNAKGFNAISVNLESDLHAHGLPLQSVLRDSEKYALAVITAAQARQHSQVLQRKPEPGDPSHAHVVGDKPKPVEKALASAAVWVIPPKNPNAN